jgi:hypothetical protein
VFSGVPQGSLLGPILFVIFIDDIVECCSSYDLFPYADDGKIFKHVLTQNACVLLQNDLDDSSSCINLEFSRNVNTRGNRFKLAKNQFHYDARKYYFVNRIVSIWNSLPDEIVSLTSLDSFKYHLDKFWSSQDIKYDWRVDMAGTGAVSLNL